MLPFRYVPAGDVPVEIRGAGQATRQVRNFGAADVFEAGNLIAVEVITPGGNWSSYPAHKHDEASAHESALEEIYYFEIAAGPHGEPGLGFHRTSASPAGNIDVLVEVRDRDTVLVPHGWHGPCAAAPGHDMYYLNVMAGPGASAPGRSPTTPTRPGFAPRGPTRPSDPRLAGQPMTDTVRLTVAQALVRFLGAPVLRARRRAPKLFAGCFGIFGHGNVAGIGQALLEAEIERPGRTALRARPQRAGHGALRRGLRPDA